MCFLSSPLAEIQGDFTENYIFLSLNLNQSAGQQLHLFKELDVVFLNGTKPGWLLFLFHFCKINHTTQLIIAQEFKSDRGGKKTVSETRIMTGN